MQTDIFSFLLDRHRSVTALLAFMDNKDDQVRVMCDEIVAELREENIICEVTSCGLFYAQLAITDSSSSALLRMKYGHRIDSHYSIDRFGNVIS